MSEAHQDNVEEVPGETPAEVSPETEEQVQESFTREEIEEAARAQGWNADGELDALGFLKNGRKFVDKARKRAMTLEQEVDQLRSIVAEHVSKVVAERNEDIETQLRRAIEDGDTETATRLAKRLADKPPEVPRGPDPVVEEWTQENTWFTEDAELRAEAIAEFDVEARKAGTDDPNVVLPRVERKIKKLYPEKFATPENPNRSRATGSARSTGARPPKGKKTLKDFPSSMTAHIEQFRTMGLSEDQIIKSLEKL